MRLQLAALSLLVCACVVVAHPPPPRVMPPPQAVAIATHFARSRGLVIDYTRSAWVDGYARWHVDIGGAGGRDRAVVMVDGFSGRVLAARLSGPRGGFPPAPAPGASAQPPGATPAPSTPPPAGQPPPPPSALPPPPTGRG
jgi:hypothetical protein